MFEKYDRKTFDLLMEQHNIMVLVGNDTYFLGLEKKEYKLV